MKYAVTRLLDVFNLKKCPSNRGRFNGYEVLAKLKSKNYTKPIIALTAHAMLEEKNKALALGFADHVTKPVDRKVLIKSILEHYQH